MTRPHLRARSGATLLEALIAIALLAALAAALAPALYGTARSSARTKLWAQGAEDSRIARDLLGDAFDAMVLYADNAEPHAVSGDARSMTLTILPTADGRPKTVTLAVARETLRYQERADLTLPASKQVEATQADLPIPRIDGFSYYGADDETEAPSWSTRWSKARPPLLIRLQRKDAPPLDFAIGRRGALDCAFDPVSRTCR